MLRNQPTLSLDLALLGMPAVLAEARRLGVRVSVSIVDAGGQLINLAHMDGAPALSRDIAIDKAYTAACFGLATSRWEAELAEAPASVRAGLAHRPRMVLFGGGVPLRVTMGSTYSIKYVRGQGVADARTLQTGVEAILAALRQ